jgi:hypothetical protein
MPPVRINSSRTSTADEMREEHRRMLGLVNSSVRYGSRHRALAQLVGIVF